MATGKNIDFFFTIILSSRKYLVYSTLLPLNREREKFSNIAGLKQKAPHPGGLLFGNE
jgi:hypothetical protein